jgi:hypothetical protein
MAPAKPAASWLWVLPPILAIAVYVQGLNNPFIYDDFDTVANNPSLENLSNWKYVLSYSFRPWVNVSYAVDRWIHGREPWGYHLTNLVLHAVNCIAVFFVSSRLFSVAGTKRSSWLAGMTACVFAVHPLHVESVNVVSQRSELWAGMAILGALLLFQRSVATKKQGWLAASAACIVVGLLCKETVAVTPFALWLYDRLFHRSDADAGPRLRRFHVPMLVQIAVGLVLRLGAFFFVESQSPPRALLQQLWMQFEVAWRYAGMLLVPVGQSAIHQVRRVSSVWDVNLFLGLLWGLVCWGAWRIRVKRPLITLAVGWFILFLLPSSLLPLQEAMAEHRAYVPSLGILWLLGWAASELWDRKPSLMPGVFAALGIWCLVLGAGALQRVQLWSDPLAVWEDAAAKAPNVWAARYALADARRERGDCAGAIPEYLQAMSLRPEEVKAHLNLGICYGSTGRLREAEAVFVEVVRIQPKEVKAFNNLATLRLMQGDVEGARTYVNRALALEPTNVTARRIEQRLGR